MKKILISLLTFLWLIPLAQAVPAYPGTYKYKQPDGTVIVLQNHGDEFYHWTTDASGRRMEKGSDGFYRPVNLSPAELQARMARARAKAPKRSGYWSSYDDPPVTNFGDRKILCILAEFQPETKNGVEVFDGKYTLENPQQHFSDMLNQAGYSYNGAIGSVRDYFLANSMNQYRPQFDVFMCPTPLSHPSSYYDDNGVDKAILEAYEKIADQIDIADYDTDGDGKVDMVLFYYPGHNEAEGGDDWTIWPHQSTGYFGEMGGKRFVRYFCTSELRGNDGEEAAAIGTTCHEFSHSLGLPDFYDVGEDENGGENSSLDLTYVFDLMCYGNYNDNGRRPPYLTSLERNMLGWMPAPTTIMSDGEYTLEGVQGNNAYRIDTGVIGEYFLLECRDGSGWDSGLSSSGLVVFHVDQSDRRIGGNTTASYLWSNTNNINSYYGHPCYYIVPSGETAYDGSHLVFPGQAGVTSYVPQDWDGNSVDVVLSGISFSGSQVSFHIASEASVVIDGFVKDVYGQPVSGATVSLVHSTYEFAAPPLIPHDDICPTDENGYYSFTLPSTASLNQVVTVTKDGYVSRAANIAVTGRVNRQDFVMMVLGQAEPATLNKYEGNTGYLYSISLGGPSQLATAMRYTAEELAGMGAVGATIRDVSFRLGAENDESVYVIVDIGGERSLWDVTSGYTPNQVNTVDLSDAHLVIPDGKDVYIGVGLTNLVEDTYPFLMYEMPQDNGGCYLMMNFLNSNAQWTSGVSVLGSPFSVVVSASLAMSATLDFAALDISYIKLEDGVPRAKPAAGKTVKSVTWTVDGTAVNGNPPAVETLSAGAHTYMARLEYYDGTAERVYFDITKE